MIINYETSFLINPQFIFYERLTICIQSFKLWQMQSDKISNKKIYVKILYYKSFVNTICKDTFYST